MGYGGGIQARQEVHHSLHIFLSHIHFQTHQFFTAQSSLEQLGNLFDFFALGRIFPGIVVGDELCIGLHQFVDDAQSVGLDGGAGFGHLHDGVGQTGDHFGFGCTP